MLRKLLRSGFKSYEKALGTALGGVLALQPGVSVGKGLRARGLPHLRNHPGARIVIGDDVRLYSSELSNLIGVNHRVILATMAPGASIEIGDRVAMSGGSVLARSKITIGDDVMIGANCLVIDNDMHPLDPGARLRLDDQVPAIPVTIGRGAWLGGNVIVLKGVHIGEDAVIGAGSVVTSDVPGRSVAAGVPARVIGTVEGPSKRRGENQGSRKQG